LFLVATLYSASSGSVELDGDFSLGVSHSDNVSRVPTGEIEETIAETGMFLSVVETSRRLDAEVRSDLNYYNYLDNTYDNEVVAAVDAVVNLTLVEDRVIWRLQENYGRTLFDPFQADRPENWENVNFLTTGPAIVVYQDGRNDSGINLSYSRMNYETRPFDNERQGAGLWIAREVRRDRTLSLNAEMEKVEFDNGVTPEYERLSTYLRYEGSAGRNTFDVQAGYTEQEILAETSDGILLDASWIRQVSGMSEVYLNVGRRFSDQGNVFRYQQSITRDVDSVGDLTENGSPFLLQNIAIGYTLTGDRTTIDLRVGATEQEYETQSELDRKDAVFDLFIQRDLTRSLFTRVDVTLSKREFMDIQREDDTLLASLSFGYRLSAALDISLRYTRFSRESDAVENEFDENRGNLTLTYIPAWAR
jgi:hypothetical protein